MIRLDYLGDWNPQLLRELKGRLKPQTLIVSGSVSVLSQILVLLKFYADLPSNIPNAGTLYSRYCTGYYTGDRNDYYAHYTVTCLQNASGDLIINWQVWWLEVFKAISLVLPFVLLVVGAYILISDIAKEERRGTFNFIRLSPRASQNILLGKLLGTPILLYLGTALVVPLHIWSGLTGGATLGSILSFYATLLASCCLFYSASLLYALLGGLQAWLGALLVFITLFLFKNVEASLGYGAPGDLQWFSIPIGRNLSLAQGLLVLTCVFWTYWIWQALDRRFNNPGATPLSKQQSYLLTACFEVLLIGFFWHNLDKGAWQAEAPFGSRLLESLFFLSVFNLLAFLGLIAALSPHRQTLQDWARYQHQNRATANHVVKRNGNTGNTSNQRLIQDLLWGERSPALVAIAVNTVIAATVLVPWILLCPSGSLRLQALLSLELGCGLILVCAVLVQLLLLMKTPKRVLWALGTLGAVIVLPPIVLLMLSLTPKEAADLWLLTAFPVVALSQASAMSTGFALLGQWSVFVALSLRLHRQLRQAGESATKALLAGRPALAPEP
ncbi:ABC transporter permease [Leptolyngbya sp. FACHB-261]|uniref:ABC transporter permease n=1 Tax=Leptolyngbya sp. FACHB-261 TaxID=2692806 RepID=UPI001682B279|nr:ABC transporter permease [Leptolyngbya sp. FACHB-261]MBD2100497.1 ABC transporter permease [Leptolyngbya sp. FACHB-261]